MQPSCKFVAARKSGTVFARFACAVVTAGALALASISAHAQAVTRSQDDVLGTIDTRMDQLKPGAVTLDLGVGTIITSRVDARASKIYPIVPYVSSRYEDWFALDENEARLNLFKTDGGLGSSGWRAGPMIKVDTGRPKFTSSNLEALPKIDPTVEVGGYVSYTLGPARARVSVRGDATGAHGGTIAEFNLRSGFYQSGRLSMAAEVEVDWVSRTYMQTFHGVTADEAAQTGLQPFDAHGGLHNADTAIMGQFQFAPHWSLIGVTQFSRLLGQAADSPITQRRRLANRANLGTFVVYTF